MPGDDNIYGTGTPVQSSYYKASGIAESVAPENYKEIQEYLGTTNPLPYDQETLNQLAYESQSAVGNLLKGVGRVATRAVAEVLSTPGYLVAAGTGMTGNGWDNAWISSIQEGMNNINQEYLPTYVSTAVQEGGIIGKLTDSAWWGTTGADGIGFMVGMMGGGFLMNTVKAGRLLTGTAGALARGAEALGGTTQAAEMLAAGSRLSTSGLGKFARTMQTISQSQVAANRAQSIMNVFANTIIESSAEANNTYMNLRQELINKGYSEEDANKIAGNAASNVFSANVGILALSNTIMEKYVFRGFDTQANISRRMSGLKFFDDAPVTAGAKGAAKEAVEGVAEGVAAEGVERAAVGEAAEQVGVELEQRAAGEVAEGTAEGVARGAADDLAATVIREGERTSKGIAKRTLKENLGIYAKNAAINGISEGFQEGMQTSTEQYFTESAMKGELNNPWNIPGNLFAVGEKYLQNLTELESTESSREFYEAVALGGILGGGASAIGTGGDLRAEEEALFGSPGTQKRGKFLGSEFAGRTLDRITGRKEKAPSKGMVNYFTEMVKANTIPYGELLKKDENGNFEFDENGQYVLDQEKIKAVAGASEELTKMMSMNALAEAFLSEKEANGTITQEERVHLEGVKNNREAFLLSPYISTEGGVEIFKAHVDQIVEKMYSENTKADNFFLTQEKMRLIDKVERLSKQRRIIENTNHSTTSFLDEEPGTADEKMMFRHLVMADKMNVGAQMDYYDNALKNIDDEIKRTEAEVERNKEANRVNPQLEQELSEKKDRKKHLDDMYKETVKSYNELFDNNKLLKEFNDFKNNEGKYGMSEEERLRQAVDDPEYLNKLFDKKGIDYKEDFDEVHVDFNDVRFLLWRKDGKLYFTDEGKTAVFNWDPATKSVKQIPLLYKEKDSKGKETVVRKNIEDFETSPETIEVVFKRRPDAFTIYDREESKKLKEDRIRGEAELMRKEMMIRLDNEIEQRQDNLNALELSLNKAQKATDALTKKFEKEKSRKEEAIQKIENSLKKANEDLKTLEDDLTARNKETRIDKANTKIERILNKLSEARKAAADLYESYNKALSEIKEDNKSLRTLKSSFGQAERELNFLKKYRERLEALEIGLEQEAEKQLSEEQERLMLSLVREAMNVEDDQVNKINTIKKLLALEINKNITYQNILLENQEYYNIFTDALGKLEDLEKQLTEQGDRLKSIINNVDEITKRVEEINQRLNELRSIAPKERTKEQVGELWDLQAERSSAIGKSTYYKRLQKEAQEKFDAIAKEINELKKEEAVAFGELFGRIKRHNEILTKIRLESLYAAKEEMYKFAEEEEQDEVTKEADEEIVSNLFSRPTNPFLLTGRDVEFDTVNGRAVDKRDKDGNLVRNPNLYSKAWFDYVNSAAKKNKGDMQSHLGANNYVAVTYATATDEMKEAIDSSIDFDRKRGAVISEEEKMTGVYVFIRNKETGKLFRGLGSNKIAFTSFRSTKNLESKIGLKGEELQKAIENYTDFIDAITEKITAEGEFVLSLDANNPIGSKHYNRVKGGKGYRVKDIFAWYQNDKNKEFYLQNLGVSEGEVSVGGRIYKMKPGTPYYVVQNAPPLILHQRTLTEKEAETVMYLMSTEETQIEKVPVAELLATLINVGKRSSNVFELYKKGDTIYYKEGANKKPSSISAEVLRKPEKERTEVEKKAVENFKEHLQKRYFYVNKKLLGKNVDIPFLEKGIIKLRKDVNYSKQLLDDVLEARIQKDKPFVQSNLVIDPSNLTSVIKERANKRKSSKKTETSSQSSPTTPPVSTSTVTGSQNEQSVNNEQAKTSEKYGDEYFKEYSEKALKNLNSVKFLLKRFGFSQQEIENIKDGDNFEGLKFEINAGGNTVTFYINVFFIEKNRPLIRVYNDNLALVVDDETTELYDPNGFFPFTDYTYFIGTFYPNISTYESKNEWNKNKDERKAKFVEAYKKRVENQPKPTPPAAAPAAPEAAPSTEGKSQDEPGDIPDDVDENNINAQNAAAAISKSVAPSAEPQEEEEEFVIKKKSEEEKKMERDEIDPLSDLDVEEQPVAPQPEGLSAEPVNQKEEQVDVSGIDNLIEENVSESEIQQISDSENIKKEDVKEAIKKEVLRQLKEKSQGKERTLLQKVAAKIKSLLLNIFIISTLFTAGSFRFPSGENVFTYRTANIENLKSFEKTLLDQEEINKLGNVNAITNYQKNKSGKYIIVDKSVGIAHLYEGDSLITSYEIGVGENVGDEQTVLKSIFFDKNGKQVSANEATYQKDGVSYLKKGYSSKTNWTEGNKKTGAGIFTVSKRGTYHGDKAFYLKNERGIAVPMAIHKVTNAARRTAISDKDYSNNRLSNGCLNFNLDDLENLWESGFAEEGVVYILPDNPHNEFVIEDGEIRFKSSDKDVNRTITNYEPIPITIKAANVNEKGKEYLQTLSESKPALMKLYPTVSNDVYNQIAKVAYGIFGQESSFGSYGGLRGQFGRVTDIAQLGAIELGIDRNPSIGVTQIRLSSVDQKTRNTFGINESKDLLDIEKSAQATMSLLLNIYVNEIPEKSKERFLEAIPLIYSNQRNDAEKVFDGESVNNSYLNNVTNHANKTSVYIGVSEKPSESNKKSNKIIDVDQARSILKNLEETNQVTKNCF